MATNNSINANSTTPLPIVDGGTQVTSVTTSPTATAFAGWDANKNLSAVNHIEAYTTTVTSATPVVLTVGSNFQQFFTGSTAQTVTLPVANTLVLGQSFLVVNNSTAIVTVQSSGSNTVTAMAASTQAVFTCILASGTSASSWSSDYSSKSFTAPTIQKFTSSTGTYTTPTSPVPLYIRVIAAGGGGGGTGSGVGGATGGTGGNTTFGTTLIVANGAVGPAGGSTASLGSAIGIANIGQNGFIGTGLINSSGGNGGSTPFSGGGSGGQASGANPLNAVANTGSGGGGGQGSGTVGGTAGGGAGAYVDGIIVSPTTSYSYAVGSGGSGGAGGTGGTTGANGAAGIIIVYEYYQ